MAPLVDTSQDLIGHGQRHIYIGLAMRCHSLHPHTTGRRQGFPIAFLVGQAAMTAWKLLSPELILELYELLRTVNLVQQLRVSFPRRQFFDLAAILQMLEAIVDRLYGHSECWVAGHHYPNAVGRQELLVVQHSSRRTQHGEGQRCRLMHRLQLFPGSETRQSDGLHPRLRIGLDPLESLV